MYNKTVHYTYFLMPNFMVKGGNIMLELMNCNSKCAQEMDRLQAICYFCDADDYCESCDALDWCAFTDT